MDTATDAAGLAPLLARWRREGRSVALVPTMGNLHTGHMKLVGAARARADATVATVFVNPLQFDDGKDLERYPRTLEADAEKLDAAGCDCLFAPGALYGRDPALHTRVRVPGLSDILCGESRPGHFEGVATVVCKLFGLVRPDFAFFGLKDYQQFLIVRRLAEDLAPGVRIVGVETEREPDGLAMSSRNGALSPAERGRAAGLHRALERARRALLSGRREHRALESEGLEEVRRAGLEPDYFAIRHDPSLRPARADDRDVVVLAAAFAGPSRLIDNIRLRLD